MGFTRDNYCRCFYEGNDHAAALAAFEAAELALLAGAYDAQEKAPGAVPSASTQPGV